ncbi:MAG: hypothetical protein PHQ33_06235 [Bacteroidales bacterium]|nr:hypothetical protein [Bacteroidales bacterium]
MKNFHCFLFTIIVVIVLLFSFSTIQAQNKSGVSIHLGGMLPLGQFTENPSYIAPDPYTEGSAMFGASLGLRYNYRFINTRIEDLGVGIFMSADLMWNAMNKELRDAYDIVSKTKPMYANVPIILGASYTSTFSDVFAVWAEAGVGCDLFLKTTEGWSGATTTYKMDPAFAAEAGVGVMFVNLVSIGIHYYWLGNHDVVGTSKVSTPIGTVSATIPEYKLPIHQMAFKLGFHF